MDCTEEWKNMVYKRFSVKLTVRVALLLVNLVVLSVSLTTESRLFTSIVATVFLVVQLYSFIRFVNFSNSQLSRFIEAVKHSDLSISKTNDELGESFGELNQSLRGILKAIAAAKLELEAQYQYLNLIINHIETGIIAIDGETIITLFNKAYLTLPGIEDCVTYDKLSHKNPELANLVKSIEPNAKILFEYKLGSSSVTLSLQASKVKVLGKDLKLITFSNIASEVEQKEVEAWHKLIQTMAHEIMNSVTPISSLTETCLMLMEDEQGNQKPLSDIDEKHLTSIYQALKTIEKRSDGLYNFVNDYRKLTRIPTPEREWLEVKPLLESICGLMQAEFEKSRVKISLNYQIISLTIYADRKLIEQVIINLLKNSIDALKDASEKLIEIQVEEVGRTILLHFTDNGEGISPENISKIFIPFFTTKQGGSGIGLSLSKQIMQLHNGNIKVAVENGRTVFTLVFPIA
jgi:nitrogen fixation/metabolism regulation signal transduction histidine kinase